MPTALALGPEGWKRYTGSPGFSGGAAADERERLGLIASAHEAAAVLRREFGARGIWLFGSVAHAEWFDPDSDVDLAVEGLDAKSYWEAWRRVESFFPRRRVDLVELETASDSLRDAIDRYGVPL